MKEHTVVLLRHAKAEHPGGIADVDRPLTRRGHADATAAGAWLASHGLVPQLVLCSPAKRTRQTWQDVWASVRHGAWAVEGQAEPPVRFEPGIYDGSPGELLSLLQQTDDAVDTLLVIGHNPTISLVSALLDPDADTDRDGLRTGGIAVHRVRGHWRRCRPGAAELTAAHTARDLVS